MILQNIRNHHHCKCSKIIIIANVEKSSSLQYTKIFAYHDVEFFGCADKLVDLVSGINVADEVDNGEDDHDHDDHDDIQRTGRLVMYDLDEVDEVDDGHDHDDNDIIMIKS